ncbi:hypothetical protein ES708_07299 [subsurface metagenome]
MNYLCLRKCFVAGRLWQEGEVYSLPKGMQKDPKNFRPMETPKPTAVISKEMYRCGKCDGHPFHRETSKIGKRHLKFKVD